MAAMLMSHSAESQTSAGMRGLRLTIEHREPEQFGFVETSKKPSEPRKKNLLLSILLVV